MVSNVGSLVEREMSSWNLNISHIELSHKVIEFTKRHFKAKHIYMKEYVEYKIFLKLLIISLNFNQFFLKKDGLPMCQSKPVPFA